MNTLHMFAHLTLRPGTLPEYLDMRKDLFPLVERLSGWKLIASYLQQGTEETEVVVVWEIPSVDSVTEMVAQLAAEPAFREIAPILQRCVALERFRVMTALPAPL